ncbi:ribonuclease H-like domain-containing protein [Tanacetum coccineum]
MITLSQLGIVKPIDRLSLNTFSISHIPKNLSHALQDPHWRNAMYDEYNALVKNGTWLLVPRPAGVNMVRSMWLFKHKFHADGTLNRYKARLVANGSSQQLDVDFDETFSPVVKPAIIRTVLSLTVSRQWLIHQLNVKNAFLNGDLSETVYTHQPPGFVDSRYPYHVCLLQRSLYGLKQAPRAWFERFAGYATRAGFYHNRCDSSLFIYRQGSQVAYLLIYVNDSILTASSPDLLQHIIASLHNEFDITDLGALNYFLGISIDRTSTGDCGFWSPVVRFRTTSLVGYTDVDWAGCSSTRMSTSGYCIFLGDSILSWLAKRQHTLSRFSAEAEYCGVANVVVEIAWLRNLLRELHSPLSTATLVYCDNVSAVYMSANPVQHQQMKHIEIDIHFVCDMVTTSQVTDISRYGYIKNHMKTVKNKQARTRERKSEQKPEAKPGKSSLSQIHYGVVLRWLLFGSGVVVVDMENCEDEPVTLTCRSKLKLIRTKFRNTPREELFRNTCFGWLLDLDDSQENCVLIHFMTCRQVERSPEDTVVVPFTYHVNGHYIEFGREEFCLITGLRFGPEFSERYEVGLIPFRRLLFDSDTDGGHVTGQMLVDIINGEEFDNLHDEDVVSVCQLAVLHLVLLGRQLAHNILDWWLRLIDDKKIGKFILGVR